MMPWPHPLRALEAMAGEGESVNSYREENFSLLCELMGLPGVRLQLETVLELSSVDWTKVSRLLSVNQDPRVRLWAGGDSLCALCVELIVPLKNAALCDLHIKGRLL